MHEGAVETIQQRRLYRAVDTVSAAAAVLAEQRLARLGERRVDPLLAEPACIGGRLHNSHLPCHVCMLHATELRALDLVCAVSVALNHTVFEGAGHDVVFDAKCRDEEVVDHVL